MEEKYEKREIILDTNSLELLEKVHPVHRHSLINVAISLISKTDYYRTLTGEINEDLNKVTDIGISATSSNDDLQNIKTESNSTNPVSPTWDNF